MNCDLPRWSLGGHGLLALVQVRFDHDTHDVGRGLTTLELLSLRHNN